MRGAYFERSTRGPSKRRVHLVQKEEPPALRLLHRLLKNLTRQAAYLDVHLESGDPLARSGYLKVHIAVVIFCAGNIGQDGVVVALLHQAHRHAGNRAF